MCWSTCPARRYWQVRQNSHDTSDSLELSFMGLRQYVWIPGLDSTSFSSLS